MRTAKTRHRRNPARKRTPRRLAPSEYFLHSLARTGACVGMSEVIKNMQVNLASMLRIALPEWPSMATSIQAIEEMQRSAFDPAQLAASIPRMDAKFLSQDALRTRRIGLSSSCELTTLRCTVGPDRSHPTNSNRTVSPTSPRGASLRSSSPLSRRS